METSDRSEIAPEANARDAAEVRLMAGGVVIPGTDEGLSRAIADATSAGSLPSIRISTGSASPSAFPSASGSVRFRRGSASSPACPAPWW
jgi:hypothetical protein